MKTFSNLYCIVLVNKSIIVELDFINPLVANNFVLMRMRNSIPGFIPFQSFKLLIHGLLPLLRLQSFIYIFWFYMLFNHIFITLSCYCWNFWFEYSIIRSCNHRMTFWFSYICDSFLEIWKWFKCRFINYIKNRIFISCCLIILSWWLMWNVKTNKIDN